MNSPSLFFLLINHPRWANKKTNLPKKRPKKIHHYCNFNSLNKSLALHSEHHPSALLRLRKYPTSNLEFQNSTRLGWNEHIEEPVTTLNDETGLVREMCVRKFEECNWIIDIIFHSKVTMTAWLFILRIHLIVYHSFASAMMKLVRALLAEINCALMNCLLSIYSYMHSFC